MDRTIRHLFVYGTLRPCLAGAEQRRLIAGCAVAGPATVPGILLDLGPYPGLLAGEGLVHGDLLVVSDERQLALLDAYEECAGDDPLYRRERTVATRPDGTSLLVWTYYYCGPIGLARALESGNYRDVQKPKPG